MVGPSVDRCRQSRKKNKKKIVVVVVVIVVVVDSNGSNLTQKTFLKNFKKFF